MIQSDLSVTCPYCHASPGAPCVTTDTPGRGGTASTPGRPVIWPHAARQYAEQGRQPTGQSVARHTKLRKAIP